jgi:hypothetical protein
MQNRLSPTRLQYGRIVQHAVGSETTLFLFCFLGLLCLPVVALATQQWASLLPTQEMREDGSLSCLSFSASPLLRSICAQKKCSSTQLDFGS